MVDSLQAFAFVVVCGWGCGDPRAVQTARDASRNVDGGDSRTGDVSSVEDHKISPGTRRRVDEPDEPAAIGTT